MIRALVYNPGVCVWRSGQVYMEAGWRSVYSYVCQQRAAGAHKYSSLSLQKVDFEIGGKDKQKKELKSLQFLKSCGFLSDVLYSG